MSRILFLSNHFITLYSFRKELISKLCEEGHEVYLSMPKDEENVFFEKMGCKIIVTDIDRRGMNPLNDLSLIKQYIKMMGQINPDIIFSYTIKPNIYGSIASNKLGLRQICNITGTGATFLKDNFLSKIAEMLYKISVKKSYRVFFQNTGDRDFFLNRGMVKDNYEVIPGSGCNIEEHTYSEMPEDTVTKFIFIGRAMELKGIDEYLQCAERISKKYDNTKFYIAGWNEEEKYKKIVNEYEEKGYVECLGFRKDIGQVVSNCHCTILPSRGGEGVPNVVLETAARGRACIGSNIKGTTDAIDDGKTGYIFQMGNVDDLCQKVEKFLHLPMEEKRKMGIAGRKKIEKEFDRNIVIQIYMDEVRKTKDNE